MADVPPAPDELDTAEKAVWRRGFQAGAHFVAGYAQHVASEMEAAESDATAAESDGTCPECGAELLEAFGNERYCPNGHDLDDT